MTQAHYIDSVKDDQELDPQFKNLLKHHWMEESQHAKLDTMVVDRLAREGDAAAIEKAFAHFAAIGDAVGGLLQQQTQLDLESLQAAAGRKLSAQEREQIAAVQLKAYRYTFLASGLLHKNFLATCDQLSPGSADKMREMAKALSA